MSTLLSELEQYAVSLQSKWNELAHAQSELVGEYRAVQRIIKELNNETRVDAGRLEDAPEAGIRPSTEEGS